MALSAVPRAMFLASVILALGGCEGARQFVGIDRSTPDEFAVVSRPPLTMPPDYQLRPPRQAGRVEANTQVQQARETVFGVNPAAGQRPAAPAGAAQNGEAALLARAGATASTANIRATIDRESAVLARVDETFLDRLLNWRDPAPRGTVIDPAAEARRLQENQALGRPPTAGETPTIERRRRGLLEGLF